MHEFVCKNGLIVSGSGVFTQNSITASSGILGDLNGTASYAQSASIALTSSFALNAKTQTTVLSASWVSASNKITLADSASFVAGANVIGTVANATTAATANAISFVPATATSASWVSASNKITLADSSSYVAGANVVGAVANATTAATANAISFVPVAALSASWVSASNLINSSSYAGTASVLLGNVSSATLATSASFASNSISSSYASTLKNVTIDSAQIGSGGASLIIGLNTGIASPYLPTASVQIGYFAGAGSSAGQYFPGGGSYVSTQIGYNAGFSSSNVVRTVQIGDYSGYNCLHSDGVIQIGGAAGSDVTSNQTNNTHSNAIEIGINAGAEVMNATNALVIGNNAGLGSAGSSQDISNAVLIGSSTKGGSGSIAIGANASASINQTVIGTPFITSALIYGAVTASGLLVSSSVSPFPFQVIGNINNESEVLNTNNNSGNTASADFVAFNNLGSAASYQGIYGIDLGINSSGYTYGFIGKANDSYLFNTGSQSSSFWIGNLDLTGSIYLWAGSSTNSGSGLWIQSQSISTPLGITSSAGFSGIASTASYIASTALLGSGVYNLTASNATKSYNGSLGFVTFTSNVGTCSVQQTYNMGVTRQSAGVYLCSFNTFFPASTWYGVQVNAVSSSTQTLAATKPTASFGAPFTRTLTGFTMSFAGPAITSSFDPCTASLVVFGY